MNLTYVFFLCRVVMLKDAKTKKTTVLFDAQDCLTKLKAPIVRDIKVCHFISK